MNAAQRFVFRGVNGSLLLILPAGVSRLGRDSTNDLTIDDPSVSTVHCEISVGEDSIIVKDLRSTNGTFVDSVRIRESFIRPGQTLRLGRAELRLELESESSTEPSQAETPRDLPRVAIPEITIEQPRTHAMLPDGVPACLDHSDTPATFQCVKCNETFCDACVHRIGLEGSKPMIFCPVCSGRCNPLPSESPRRPKKAWHKQVLRRLTASKRRNRP